MDGIEAIRSMADVWFFGFDLRLRGFSKRSGHAIGPDVLEPVTYMIYEHARRMTPAHLLNGLAVLNRCRRQLGRYFTKYDVWLSPTTTNAAEAWGNYHLGRPDVTMDNLAEDHAADCAVHSRRRTSWAARRSRCRWQIRLAGPSHRHPAHRSAGAGAHSSAACRGFRGSRAVGTSNSAAPCVVGFVMLEFRANYG